jgi:Flp pilus assembly protein TadD
LAHEEQIWALWMYHPHRYAARQLDLATGEIARNNLDIAETRLARLTRALPHYSEAWHKIATLYYLQKRDDECIVALRHVLTLEPRHFAAMGALAELLLTEGDFETAQFVFESALRIHPHQFGVRERLAELSSQKTAI